MPPALRRGSFEAAACHNILECLPYKRAFLGELARVLTPGGHLLLGHTDFDTMVFNASDIELTRGLVHANADTQEAWMDASDDEKQSRCRERPAPQTVHAGPQRLASVCDEPTNHALTRVFFSRGGRI